VSLHLAVWGICCIFVLTLCCVVSPTLRGMLESTRSPIGGDGYTTKIRIKKFPHKLCIKKDCCIFVLMLWCEIIVGAKAPTQRYEL